MNTVLPDAVRKYQRAIIDNNSSLFDECFTEDAVVTDAGKTYSGIQAIKNWGDDLSTMNLKTEIISTVADGTSASISTHVYGDFKRSPLTFRYHITLQGNKISRLDIKVVQ